MSKLPETGPSLLRKLRQAQRQALRQAQSSAFTRSGASVSSPGMLSSDDFDGVDRTHLGTTGWALGSFDGGPSYLALNGVDVYAKLTEKDAELTAMQATLTAQQAALTAQQASLTAAVADIAANVADIADLVGAQVTGATNTTFASGVSLNATPQSVAAVTVTVPAGFSIARIMAVSSLATGDSVVNCQTRIQGNDGGALTGVHGVASSAHARTLTGLSGGTITASTLAGSIPNTTGDMVNTTIFAMFFR